MKKFLLKLSKLKFELKKVVLGIIYLCLFLSLSKILTGNFNLELFVMWSVLSLLLTIQQLALYATNTKWNESIKL